jgi:hypothetical protein
MQFNVPGLRKPQKVTQKFLAGPSLHPGKASRSNPLFSGAETTRLPCRGVYPGVGEGLEMAAKQQKAWMSVVTRLKGTAMRRSAEKVVVFLVRPVL